MEKSKYTSTSAEKLHQERQSKIQQVYRMLAETEVGLCVKDISAKMGMSVEAVRRYMKELLARDLIYVAAKDGKTRLFKANMSPKPPKTEEEAKAKIEEALPVSPDGKEFDPGTFTPCGDVCRPGDIVWVSSRSGEGQFFRYLVITPWERKAMVLGIFAEGHPALNLNDPNYIYLGNDPETGEGLYADVTNTCQRGYKQFGDLLMHVDKDCMDAVKNRLARVMQFDDICGKTIVKEVIKDDPKKDVAIERLKKVIEDKMKLKILRKIFASSLMPYLCRILTSGLTTRQSATRQQLLRDRSTRWIRFVRTSRSGLKFSARLSTSSTKTTPGSDRRCWIFRWPRMSSVRVMRRSLPLL